MNSIESSITSAHFWKQIGVPPFAERLVGFSIPHQDKILIVSYEGVHLLRLGTEIIVENNYENAGTDIYDSESGSAKHQGEEYKIIGLFGGTPILDGLDGEVLKLDREAETLSIEKDGTTTFAVEYENFSGDWAAATFSTDRRFIVLGCSYDFNFLVFERCTS